MSLLIEPELSTNKPTLMGAVEPRLHSVLLTGKTLSKQITKLAEQIGMPLMPWQQWVLDDMMRVDSNGMFIRKTNLLLLPRQQGKTHLATMLIIWNLMQGLRCVAMSSNRGMALDTFRNVVYIMESNEFLRKMMKGKARMANGQEAIYMKNGGKYEIVAATRDGARGRNADFLFIDELREIDEVAFQAATPLTRSHANAQTLLVSNAGDAFSEVLNTLRSRCLSYPPKTLGFYEYSANPYAKDVLNNRQEWARANPALGWTVTEETLEEAVATSTVETTKTEMLCLWIDSLQSPWPHGVLEATSDSTIRLDPGSMTIMAFDVALSRRTASLVAGQIDGATGKIKVGILQTWTASVGDVDNLKIAADISTWCAKYRPKMVCFDKYATQSIADRLANAGIVVQDVSGAAFYTACGDLLDALVNDRLVHSGQGEWVQQMNNCAAKTNDSAWRIIKRKSAGDISAAIGSAMLVTQLIKPQSSPTIMSV